MRRDILAKYDKLFPVNLGNYEGEQYKEITNEKYRFSIKKQEKEYKDIFWLFDMYFTNNKNKIRFTKHSFDRMDEYENFVWKGWYIELYPFEKELLKTRNFFWMLKSKDFQLVEIWLNKNKEIVKFWVVWKITTRDNNWPRYLFLIIATLDNNIKTFYINPEFKDKDKYKKNEDRYIETIENIQMDKFFEFILENK